MASGDYPTSLEGQGARKVLHLLDALRRTPAGNAIYRQVELLLEQSGRESRSLESAALGLIHLLMDGFIRMQPEGSPLQVHLRLLQARLQPPLSAADLALLQPHLEIYLQQMPQADSAVLQEAMAPLLQAFGITEHASPAAPAQARPYTRPPPRETRRVDDEAPAAADADMDDAPGQTDSLIMDGSDEALDDGLDSERQVASAYRNHLDARRRDIQKLQSNLAQQVLETITQNQEFGVMLEVVMGELREAGEIADIENLRWTLIREMEKLTKGHHELADRLDSTHHYLQVIESDSRQLSDELTRVRLLSLTDELTELPNRRAFLRRLEDEVARVQRYGFPLSLALIDLDKFKDVNDAHGHQAGDEVLRTYSRNILSIFRHHDLVARYGGEEFAVLLANTDSEGAARALSKVRKRAGETRWSLDGQAVPVPSFSAGLALYKPGETSAAFIERADKALYRAKRMGRDRVELDTTYLDGESDAGREHPDPASQPPGEG